jgi:protein-S-isoprenylcysteine O-methyltransferase Ste14
MSSLSFEGVLPFPLSPLLLCRGAWLTWLAYWLWAARNTQATKSSEGVLGRLQHLVPLLIAFFLIFHSPTQNLVYGRWHDRQSLGYVGLALTVLGLLFTAWGRVHLGRYWSGMVTLKEGHRLIRTGPYALVRHPLYTGFLLAAAGSALAAETVDAAVGFALILVAYLVKLRREETLLTREFGDEYLRFKREVPALVPFVH